MSSVQANSCPSVQGGTHSPLTQISCGLSQVAPSSTTPLQSLSRPSQRSGSPAPSGTQCSVPLSQLVTPVAQMPMPPVAQAWPAPPHSTPLTLITGFVKSALVVW